MFFQIIIATIIGSVLSLIGGVILLWKEKLAKKLSSLLVSFAVGTLFGVAFFDLLPEALENSSSRQIFPFAVLGILTLFLFEKFLKWHHCHNGETCEIHTFPGAVLAGDTVHNFIDGVIIALSFTLGPSTGIATTAAIFIHEIPQEISDFGVLIHAGFKKSKVIFYNLLTVVTALIGATLAYFLLPSISLALPYLISFAAGLFIYVAAADLMPELKHKSNKIDFLHFLIIIGGLLMIWFLT